MDMTTKDLFEGSEAVIFKVISSNKARTQWGDMLGAVIAGNHIIVKRYGKPAAAVIPYQDFLELEEMLEDLHDIREGQAALAEWKRNPDSFRLWEDVKKELFEAEDSL